MTQLYPFRTKYMRENFHKIIAACEAAAYHEYSSHVNMAHPRAGL